MTAHTRSVLDRLMNDMRNNILRLTSMVDTAIEKAMLALSTRDLTLAQEVVANDREVNELRYQVEEEAFRILATQQPAASDLRNIIAAIHLVVELERIGDHAAGIARLVKRLEGEEEIDTLHKLPKMAKRARQMIQESIQAYLDRDPERAQALFKRDDKIDRLYNKLFAETLAEMQDENYLRRATFLLWVGHNLERMGDRATNIAERVIFMATGQFTETVDDYD